MTAIETIYAATEIIIPEIILIATVCVMFLTGPFLVTENGTAAAGLRHRWGIVSLLALGFALITWANSVPQAAPVGPFDADSFSWFVRGISLFLGVVLVLLLWNQIDDAHSAEAHACLLAILAGANFTALANDLVILVLGLELVSISTYILLYIPKRDRAMQESTMKYFLLSIFSAGMLMYGIAWLFGSVGTTNLPAIAEAFKNGTVDPNSGMIRLAQIFIIAGLAFRITAVPFHFYAPDVFQGITSSTAAMLSFIPKVVGFVGLIRLLPATTGFQTGEAWMPPETIQTVLAAMAILTMFAGNLLAFRQKNLYRLMAYSSVAHAGYMMIGLTVGNTGPAVDGLAALWFYLVVYGFMTIGFFAILASLGPNIRTDSDLAGLSRTKPILAVLLAICLLSLMGVPPTAGFFGKLYLFLAAWNEGTGVGRLLAITLAANAAIAAAYYLRLISVVYLDQPKDSADEGVQLPAWIASGVCAAVVLILFAVPQQLWNAALKALS